MEDTVMIVDEQPTDAAELPGPYEAIADALAEVGWTTTDDFLPPALVGDLAREMEALWGAGAFRQAGTGRAERVRVDPMVRGDHLKWVEPSELTEAQGVYLARLEELRSTLNRTLHLGLVDLEVHLSVYPPGSFYCRHLDQFHGVGHRAVTTVLYLNAGWHEGDGGELLIYTDPADEDRFEAILPLGGRLVTFLSDRFPHEVVPTRRQRLSVSGWFRRRQDLLH
jgi:SM-20-related protein